MAAEIHLDDVGTIFRATILDETGVAADISLASKLELIFKKPDGTSVVMDAEFTSNGVDGKIQYVTVADDLDTVGTWKVQGYVEIGNAIFHSDIHSFKVYANLPRPTIP